MLSERERKALILIGAALVAGIALILAKAYRPSLFLGEPDFRAEDVEAKSEIIPSETPPSSEERISKPVNINRASREELQKLPGIGPTLADRIVQYREKHGKFKRIEEIKEVSGIGEGKFQRIKSLITISSQP
ncbi:TPA: helix-hairpin-helix domain-containing protein [Candidatus Poribacteria bacterium]|nr:helix-hairpin-helix domain-containing protein [Candidatus Poribacteria bacterium]HEX29344.1 helix-hairpin-helix domain-containing protein [Candidatus Poribacteria bacterium]